MMEMKGIDGTYDRAAYLSKLAEPGSEWDILVIGGGATGLGVALEAVSRGYKTLLVEQADFAKGTSSRSTKLVHGGVRYLAQGDIRLVREASIERGLLHRNAPHLVKDQLFIVPVYSLLDRLKYTIGLKLYDRIAGKLRLGPSVFISKEETLRRLPGIRAAGLKGGVVYHDGQFDDSRLAVNIAQTIWENGGDAINYMKVVGLFKSQDGKLTGASVLDIESGKQYRICAKVVVNATGVFVDDILQLDNPGGGRTICVSQGVHIVLDKSFYSADAALMIPRTSDGRVLFAVPWHDKVVVGTTDTPVDTAELEPRALEKEINFILDTASAYLEKAPQRSDVLSVFAGQRPLAAPKNGEQTTKEISRSHKIIVSPSRLFTMLGGKWTTYRRMGEDMVNRIEQELKWMHRSSTTANLSLHGAISPLSHSDPFYFYGSDAALIKERINGTAGQWLSEKLKIHPQQVKWAVEKEMARTVEDVLARRTRALLLDAAESRRIAPTVASIMAQCLQKDDDWVQEQVTAFTKLANDYTLK
ncbi:glycerol-3-phosphate dehydrogenase/oxidase [Flavihumibacter solisilvae]|nr:glycerol-3-phosphate dehydrogenase/oxidase [Flavihumibacter solisilvae]